MHTDNDIVSVAAHLRALGAFLRDTAYLWTPRPFAVQPVPWEVHHPALAARLRALSEDEVEAAETLPEAALLASPELRAWAAEAASLAALPSLAESGPGPGAGRPRAVKDRKWRQIEALAVHVAPHLGRATGLVDWCAGKAHLGRTLAGLTGLPVHAVERDAALVDEGRARAAEEGCTLDYVRADAFDEAARAAFGPDRALVALHACGALTDRAIELAVEARAPALAVVACCHHRLRGEAYVARSSVGRAAGLALDRRTLLLTTSDESVASARLRAVRRRELVYRAGLDRLLRAATGVDSYRGLGSAPTSWFQAGFADFVERMRVRHSLSLPSRIDLAAAEAAGREHVRRARGLGLVRAPFRRPLEVFLALDRTLALLEQGLAAEVGTFCAPALTPRNILVRAVNTP